jgi:Mg-chelatase subunit ChlD
MAQRSQYHVDIVFCIDVSGSMTPVIDLVKEKVRMFPHDVRDERSSRS